MRRCIPLSQQPRLGHWGPIANYLQQPSPKDPDIHDVSATVLHSPSRATFVA